MILIKIAGHIVFNPIETDKCISTLVAVIFFFVTVVVYTKVVNQCTTSASLLY